MFSYLWLNKLKIKYKSGYLVLIFYYKKIIYKKKLNENKEKKYNNQ